MSEQRSIIDIATQAPKEFWIQGLSWEDLAAEWEAEDKEFEASIKTKKGRDAIASFAVKPRTARKALDDTRKEIQSNMLETQKRIDALVKDVFERRRKPLTEWEAQEKARVDSHKAVIKSIEEMAFVGINTQSSEIEDRREKLLKLDLGKGELQEFSAKAEEARAKVLSELGRAFETAKAREEERAELERLRKLAAEKASQEPAQRQTEPEATIDPETPLNAPVQPAERPVRPVFGAAPVTEEVAEPEDNPEMEAAARAISNECGILYPVARAIVAAVSAGKIPHMKVEG